MSYLQTTWIVNTARTICHFQSVQRDEIGCVIDNGEYFHVYHIFKYTLPIDCEQ